MKIRIYEYKNCATCKNALKYLDARNLSYEKRPIVESPPSKPELLLMAKYLGLQGKTFKNLFNTSGEMYRELKIADKLKAGLTQENAIELLSKNGKLIKRPFLLTESSGTVGFNADAWDELF